MLLPEIRQEVYRLNLELPKNGLVAWTGGNVSVRYAASGLVVIKPSGVRYEQLTPENMVIVDMDGKVVEGDLKPSSDTLSHLFMYKHRSDVNGVVHTHSTYATAFAAVNMPIPAVLTAIGDEFGGPVPCGRFAFIGDEDIGRAVLEAIGDSCAVLLKNHGVFTIGKTGEGAVKAAVMVEDAARTVFTALQLGTPDTLPPEALARLHDRYINIYGQ